MSGNFRVTAAQDLDVVNDLIHDHWFNVDDVAFDEATRTLHIKFQRPPAERTDTGRHTKGPPTQWVLEIARVLSYKLEESEGIGRYDFNVLKYTAADAKLAITAGIPLVFEAIIDGIEILVRENETVPGEGKSA